MKKVVEEITIQKMTMKEVRIKIVGDSPLIVHAWSAKAKRIMLEAQQKKRSTKTKAKPDRDPFAEFVASLYWLEGMPQESTPEAFEEAVKNGAKWGFPVMAVKQSANSAAYRLGWVKNKMELRGTFFLDSEYGDKFRIFGSPPSMREDMVTIGMGTADLRYRGMFFPWHTELALKYNDSGNVGLEQIINNIDAGGTVVGIGEWRPEKDGNYGKYHVETL